VALAGGLQSRPPTPPSSALLRLSLAKRSPKAKTQSEQSSNVYRGYSPTPRKGVEFEALVKLEKLLLPPTPKGVENELRAVKGTVGEHLA